jgi:hypothetical protein|tara:strand:- start:1359 stop:2246 length:888 start_codon:yes stop_codon:yes gene_type:complete
MAISTYSELQTAVANWLDRDDLSARIPEFVTLAETRMNRVLRIRIMEKEQILSTIGGSKRYLMPTDYLQMLAIKYNNSQIASTTLNGDINDSVASITLTDASSFSASGTILVGTEQITYSSIAGNILTVSARGANSTTPAEHTTGATVVEIYTTWGTGSISTGASTIRTMQYITPEIMARTNTGTSTGLPQSYTMRAGYIFFGPVPDAVYTIEMTYYSKIPSLSDITTTSTMLTENPDLYLYGALLEAEPFLMNDARIQLWATAFGEAVNNLQLQDDKDSHSGTELRVMNTGGYY